MDRYFDARPEASKFRLRALDFQEQLGFLFGGALATGEEVAGIDETINPELSTPTRGAESPIHVSEDSDIDGEEAPETQSQTPLGETATTDQEHPSSSPSSATPVVSKKASQSSLLLRQQRRAKTSHRIPTKW
jgi:hypothetical protein